MSDTPEMATLVNNLLVQQAIESRARKTDSVWLAHSFEEAEANANLFVKAQIPMSNPKRNRSLLRAFDRITKSREIYSTRRTT